jgi:hypothetical protein
MWKPTQQTLDTCITATKQMKADVAMDNQRAGAIFK